MNDFQVAVIGSGLVGLALAKGLCDQGIKTLLIAPSVQEPDGRTSALLANSIAFLDRIGLWDDTKEFAFPLKTMRIIDGTNNLFRAPQTDFKSMEISHEAFGYNLENKNLSNLIQSHLRGAANLTRIESSLIDIKDDASGPTVLKTADRQTYSANIVVACDGKNSVVRNTLEIGERSWNYPQIAMVGNFTHSLPNNDTSTEFHTGSGPYTLVPLGQNRSSLVCVVNDETAQYLAQMPPEALNIELERRMQSILGKVKFENKLKQFPLSGMVAKRFAKGNVLLAGEAAHVFPPIGAQGLNLGLRDIAAALDLICKVDFNGDPSSIGSIGEKYHTKRAPDILARTASVDLLNRSLLTDFLPLQAGRSLGLFTLNTLSPLRKFLMKEGVAPGSAFQNPLERFVKKLRPQT